MKSKYLIVLGAWLLETVERRITVILGKPSVRLALLGELHSLVLAQCHTDLLAPCLHLVQMGDR